MLEHAKLCAYVWLLCCSCVMPAQVVISWEGGVQLDGVMRVVIVAELGI